MPLFQRPGQPGRREKDAVPLSISRRKNAARPSVASNFGTIRSRFRPRLWPQRPAGPRARPGVPVRICPRSIPPARRRPRPHWPAGVRRRRPELSPAPGPSPRAAGSSPPEKGRRFSPDAFLGRWRHGSSCAPVPPEQRGAAAAEGTAGTAVAAGAAERCPNPNPEAGLYNTRSLPFRYSLLRRPTRGQISRTIFRRFRIPSGSAYSSAPQSVLLFRAVVRPPPARERRARPRIAPRSRAGRIRPWIGRTDPGEAREPGANEPPRLPREGRLPRRRTGRPLHPPMPAADRWPRAAAGCFPPVAAWRAGVLAGVQKLWRPVPAPASARPGFRATIPGADQPFAAGRREAPKLEGPGFSRGAKNAGAPSRMPAARLIRARPNLRAASPRAPAAPRPQKSGPLARLRG